MHDVVTTGIFESTIHNRHRMRVSYNGELPPKLRHRLKQRVTSEFRQSQEWT